MLTSMGASPYISKVFEYCPAPGQFVNELPEYAPGDDAAAMLAKAQEQIAGERTPGLITLGAYGGYVVFGFDHPVVNVHGRYDFQVYGNAMPSPSHSAEPGVVSVSVDANGNGLPDDEWYELAGSAYSLPTTYHHARVEYLRPEEIHVAVPDPDNKSVTDMEYIPYATFDAPDMEGETGWLHKVSFHTQSYWPEWHDASSLTFRGTRLAPNGIDVNGDGRQWQTQPLHWGYADNLPNNAYKGFSIDWAVDGDGNQVELTHIDFVKVHTGILQNLGWIGEESTEIAGGEDLHPDAVYSPVWPSDPIDPNAEYGSPFSAVSAVTDDAALGFIYDLNGTLRLKVEEGFDASSLPAGLYIWRAADRSGKFVVK